MPTLAGFQPEEADRIRLKPYKMKASAACAFGDAMKRTATADTIEVAAQGDTVECIYWDVDRSSGETDTPMRMCVPVREDIQFRAPVESGTFTSANVNTVVDLHSADGINMTTTSGGDFLIEKYISASVALGRFVRRTAE